MSSTAKRGTGAAGYYNKTPHGLITAAQVTQFFCYRLRELGLGIEKYLDGNIAWGDLRKQVFNPSLVALHIQNVIPDAHIWWQTAHPGSSANDSNWEKWFNRGRGPIRGWLYNRLTQQDSPGKPYLPSLKTWPGSKNPFGPVILNPDVVLKWQIDTGVRTHISKTTRDLILADSDYVCIGCAESLGPNGAPFEIDHLLPRSLSKNPQALDIPENYQALCHYCNSKKRTMSPAAFVRWAVNNRLRLALKEKHENLPSM